MAYRDVPDGDSDGEPRQQSNLHYQVAIRETYVGADPILFESSLDEDRDQNAQKLFDEQYNSDMSYREHYHSELKDSNYPRTSQL